MLFRSLLFVLLVLPIISPKPKTASSSNQSGYNFNISNKVSRYISIGILLITTLFLFKADDASFDSNIEHLNFFPEELKSVEKQILDIDSENEIRIVLFVEERNKQLTKEKNFDLLLFLKKQKRKGKIIKYSNTSLFDLPEKY